MIKQRKQHDCVCSGHPRGRPKITHGPCYGDQLREAVKERIRSRRQEREWRAGLQALAAQVDQTDPQCPIGTAPTRAGLTRSGGPEPTYAQLRARVLELEQLPGPAAARDTVLTGLEDQSATVLSGGEYLRPETQARREALVFCADVIAARRVAISPTKLLTEDQIRTAILSALAETDCNLLDEVPEEVVQKIAARVVGYLIISHRNQESGEPV